jgi:hypothetical protein
VLTGLAALGAPPLRSAQTGATRVVTFGVQPAGPKKPDGRGYFSFSVTPGARLEDHFAVTNYSTQRLTLTVHTSDALNTPGGDFALLPPNQSSKDVGTWIKLPASRLTISVPARGFLIVPFSVAIPQNATPGDHVGGVIVTLESFAKTKTGQRYRLLQNVGSRMFVRVSGTLHPGLAVEGVTVRYHGTVNPIGRGRAVVTFTVRNIGNVALGGRQSVRISGLFGFGSSAVALRPLGVLLPGFSVKESAQVRGVVPQVWMTARVSITPLVLPGSVQTVNGPFQASVHFMAIPWIWLAILVLLIVAIWWRRRRRRRTPPRDRSEVPSISSGPSRDAEPDDEPEAGIAPSKVDGSSAGSSTAS